jgi:hypothetical protein
MTHLDFIPERRPDGTVVLRAVARTPHGRLRDFLRRLGARGRRARRS